MIKSHGGQMKHVQSATFYPCSSRTGSRKKDIKQIDDLPLSKGNECILFVDDELQIATLVKDILESLGYTVTAKTDACEALDLFREEPFSFDLVITDINMPKMTGDMLARELADIRKEVPIILCTGYSEIISEYLAKTSGVKGCILKPFGIELLAETVRRVLDQG